MWVFCTFVSHFITASHRFSVSHRHRHRRTVTPAVRHQRLKRNLLKRSFLFILYLLNVTGPPPQYFGFEIVAMMVGDNNGRSGLNVLANSVIL